MMKASIRRVKKAALLSLLGLLGPWLTGCSSGSGTQALSTPPIYVLSVTSLANLHEQITSVSPADVNGVAAGTTSLALYYKPGATVTLTAQAADSSSGPFLGWCDGASAASVPFSCAKPACTSISGLTCTVTMSSNINVLATYPGVTDVMITPTQAAAVVPSTTQFNVTVNGLGTYVDSSGNTQNYQGSPYMLGLVGPNNYSGALGTISATGLYTTPYPAPASVTVKATSTVFPSAVEAAQLTLSLPAATPGPALTVDIGSPTHAISPDIYGMNDAGLTLSTAVAVNLPVERWGGDLATRYNYLLDADNSAADNFFETNFASANTSYPIVSQFDTQVTQDRVTKTSTLATVPLIGYTTERITSACSYSVKKYGAQTAVDPSNKDCGNGILVTPVNGSTTVVNDPADTSTPIDQTFVSGWVKFLTGQFGTAANGGVALYGLDNEPDRWNVTHKDVHPLPFTYDELTSKGIAYATAIKSQDATALVTGPVIANWTDYFYSATDVADGISSTPSCAQANPVDRLAHGDIPLIEYYLQQFKAYETANNTRLLDYVDLHTEFAASGSYPGTAGDTTQQQARLNSTRVFWDSSYTDPNYTDPTDTASTRACQGQPYAPNLINLEKGWVANDYPGTKLAISEYNWGGQEAINGALAQADILGIFGREGLDLGLLKAPPAPTVTTTGTTQSPGVIAFEVFTNYDGNEAHFGDTAVNSTSADQGQLSVYGATRSSDGNLTVVAINKGYADLTSTLSLPNLKPNGSAQSYRYSAANLTAITSQPAVAVAATSGTSTASSLTTLFPAQSITILVIPHL